MSRYNYTVDTYGIAIPSNYREYDYILDKLKEKHPDYVKPHHPNYVWVVLLSSGSAVSASSQ